MDVATELDRLIEKRAPRQPDPVEAEPSYAASVRAYHHRQERERLWAKLRYHEAMITNHTRNFEEMLCRHWAALAKCEAKLGITDTKGV